MRNVACTSTSIPLTRAIVNDQRISRRLPADACPACPYSVVVVDALAAAVSVLAGVAAAAVAIAAVAIAAVVAAAVVVAAVAPALAAVAARFAESGSDAAIQRAAAPHASAVRGSVRGGPPRHPG